MKIRFQKATRPCVPRCLLPRRHGLPDFFAPPIISATYRRHSSVEQRGPYWRWRHRPVHIGSHGGRQALVTSRQHGSNEAYFSPRRNGATLLGIPAIRLTYATCFWSLPRARPRKERSNSPPRHGRFCLSLQSFPESSRAPPPLSTQNLLPQGALCRRPPLNLVTDEANVEHHSRRRRARNQQREMSAPARDECATRAISRACQIAISYHLRHRVSL